jgi:hypothetical protein
MNNETLTLNPAIAISALVSPLSSSNDSYNTELRAVSVSVLTICAGEIFQYRAGSKPWDIARFMSLSEEGRYPRDFKEYIKEQNSPDITQFPYIICENSLFDFDKTTREHLPEIRPGKNSFAIRDYEIPLISMAQVAEMREKAQNPYSLNFLPLQLRNACLYILENRGFLKPFFPQLSEPIQTPKYPSRDDATIEELSVYAKTVFKLNL